MHRAEIDQEHNRLILRWVDSFSVSEVDRLQAEVASLLPALRPGFDCISDIANMRPASQHVADRIEKLQAFLHESGMRRVVRIVGRGGGARIASTQMDRTAEHAGYSTTHVDTEAEALVALSKEPDASSA
jgi:Tfp pilus assembly PilM family ATPase